MPPDLSGTEATSDWRLENPALQREIEGYASACSVNRGDTIRFYVSTQDPTFTIELFRMGWYGGAGGARVSKPVQLLGTLQPTPEPDPATGLIECRWSSSHEISADRQPGFADAWTSGVYLAKLTGSSGKQRYIKFVVREDDRTPHLLFQTSDSTDQAYNNWPRFSDGTGSPGKSLYTFNSVDGERAVEVSFNRPYSDGFLFNDGYGAGSFFRWEYNMLRFVERVGYDVAYCCSISTHQRPELLLRCRAFLSVGHDEYWSNEMRSAVVAARDRGVHLGFFSANVCYWRVRFEPSAVDGGAARTMACWKDDPANVGKSPGTWASVNPADPYATDPVRVTTRWRDEPIARPEEEFLGVMYVYDPVDGDIVVDEPAHWVFENTGLAKGDKLPGLLGYEIDRSFGRGPANLQRLCHSPAFDRDTGKPVDPADMTIYTAPSNALVFAAGTIQWSWGLDDYSDPPRPQGSRVSAAAQRITRNLLDRFVA